ncbi:hypothetical protein OSTOST_24036, partial [Ostertagia ostertagi]
VSVQQGDEVKWNEQNNLTRRTSVDIAEFDCFLRNAKIEECLERHRHSLRKALADSVGVNCPELHFLPDRSKLMEEEMDRLFRIADYGMDYRAVSHTGRVLGGAETGKSKRSLKKIIDSENSDKT